jgi:hypothetical protein
MSSGQATFRVSPLSNSWFAGEGVGDVIIHPSASTQRVLLGNTTGTAPALLLDSSNATVGGNVQVANMTTNTVRTTGITLSMVTSSMLQVVAPTVLADPNYAYTSNASRTAYGIATSASNDVYAAAFAAAVGASNVAAGASNVTAVSVQPVAAGAATIAAAASAAATAASTAAATASSVAASASNVSFAFATASRFLVGAGYGTVVAPVDGGVLTVDTATSPSVIVELAAGSAAPLTLSLAPTSELTVGRRGDIVLVERGLTARTLNIDPRIFFPTRENDVATRFTKSNCTSITSAPAANGFAIDTLSYYVPKTGYALGRYSRQFVYAPPAFGAVPDVVYNSAAAPYTLDVASYLVSPSYSGPLTYAVAPATGSPALPAGISIAPASGVLMIAQNTVYTGTLAVTVTSVADVTVVAISLAVAI